MDNDNCSEPVLPVDASPAMLKFARQIVGALDYGEGDCEGAPPPKCEMIVGVLGWIDLADPRSGEWSWDDLALNLSRIHRFHGALPWTVAQHLILCHALYERSGRGIPTERAAVVLHDGHEALVGDVPSPLKRLLPDYREAEQAHMAEVHRRANLPWPIPGEIQDIVDWIDRSALHIEVRTMGPQRLQDWKDWDPIGEDLVQIVRGIRDLSPRAIQLVLATLFRSATEVSHATTRP